MARNCRKHPHHRRRTAAAPDDERVSGRGWDTRVTVAEQRGEGAGGTGGGAAGRLRGGGAGRDASRDQRWPNWALRHAARRSGGARLIAASGYPVDMSGAGGSWLRGGWPSCTSPSRRRCWPARCGGCLARKKKTFRRRQGSEGDRARARGTRARRRARSSRSAPAKNPSTRSSRRTSWDERAGAAFPAAR